ncbi:HD domain-containing protein [Streptomyces sp. NPDC052396]|uniref:HD domain-containing protein n=1 Tax=Streptomyces sp. NPDC052396 TaxID=3365689 RepID=UPI0037D7D60D
MTDSMKTDSMTGNPSADDFVLPDTDLARQALSYARQLEPGFIFRHSVRSYLFARSLAEHRGLKPGTDYDDELVFLGCVLHDLGLSEQGNGDQRFEVDGADLAARFLRDHGVGEGKVAVVWDAIVLHTSEGITARKGPEIALTQAGISVDVLGVDKELLPEGFAERVHTAFPRENLAFAMTDLIARQALANPAKAGPLGFPGQVLRRHLPHGALPDWYDLIAGAGWGDRPAGVSPATAATPAAHEPGQLPVLLERFRRARDAAAVSSLYEPGAVLVPAPGGNGTLGSCRILIAGDIALLASADTTQVARRQPDGRWLYTIDQGPTAVNAA